MKRCDALVNRPTHLGRYEPCQKYGRYLTSEGVHLCAAHLKRARAFSEHPVDTNTGKLVDRHALYYRGEIALIERR